MLAAAVAAVDPRVFGDDDVPEIVRRRSKLRIPVVFANRIESRKLGNLRVGVPTDEHVFPLGHRNPHLFVVELFRPAEIFFVPGQLVNVDVRFVNRAVFAVEQLLNVVVAQNVENIRSKPVRHFDQNRLRLFQTAHCIDVVQPQHDLIHDVNGFPGCLLFPVNCNNNRPRAGCEISFVNLLEQLFPLKRWQQIAVPVSVLTGFQLVQNIGQPFENACVAGCLIHHRHGRQIESKNMPRQRPAQMSFFRFPVRIRFLLLHQARFAPKPRQQPIRLQRKQVLVIQFLHLQKLPVGNPDVF